MCDGQQQADVLYTEADGVWVHLQRETRKHYEVKSGIAYRGWRNVGDDRYELVGKRVYGHASEQMPFWKGASLEWGKQYALERVKQFVVGGDGANWIHKGVEALGHAVFHLDGFHLARACGRGYGRRIGISVYDGIRVGSTTAARQAMSSAPPAQTKMAHRDREYVESNVSTGMDWRNRVPKAPPDARSLGNHGEQRGQAHREPNEEAGYELDHTGSASNGQGDPVGPERRTVRVLSQSPSSSQ